MEIYLPIAEQSMNVFVLFGLGAAAGLLAGMFGVGGGFLATPLLIFVGIPPAVAVASQANQVVANSVSSLQVQWRRGNVDLRMGLVLLLGGLLGSACRRGIVHLPEGVSARSISSSPSSTSSCCRRSASLMLYREPAHLCQAAAQSGQRRAASCIPTISCIACRSKLRFYKSKLYISAFLPIGLGFLIGVLSAILGVGGGFVLVPAMIYLLGMPTAVVIGTSNFQILFVAANVTFLQAATNGTVDIVLALLLILGGVVGAPIGVASGGPAAGRRPARR